MKQFENNLQSMPIPEKKDIFFEKRLRSQLIDRFVRSEKNYLWHYRIAAAVACFFAVFTFVMLFFPSQNQHAIAQKEQTIQPQPTLAENPADFETMFQPVSSDHQIIANELGKRQLDDDKTYLIRSYVTENQKTVTIVTEIESDVKPMTVKRKAQE